MKGGSLRDRLGGGKKRGLFRVAGELEGKECWKRVYAVEQRGKEGVGSFSAFFCRVCGHGDDVWGKDEGAGVE